MVEDDGDAAVWVETEKPVFLLLVGENVAERCQLSIGRVEGEGGTTGGRRRWTTYMRVWVHSVP